MPAKLWAPLVHSFPEQGIATCQGLSVLSLTQCNLREGVMCLLNVPRCEQPHSEKNDAGGFFSKAQVDATSLTARHSASERSKNGTAHDKTRDESD